MVKGTWDLEEVRKAIILTYSTENARHKQYMGIVQQIRKREGNDLKKDFRTGLYDATGVTLTDIVNGMQSVNANIDKFLDVLRELDRI